MARAARWLVVLTVVAMAGLSLAGCGRPKADTTTMAGPGSGEQATKASRGPTAKMIEVLVPCGQAGPFSKIAKLFEKQNPGLKLRWTPENMVVIQDKVLDGKAKPDAVLSMGDVELNRLEKKGLLVPGTRVAYAANSLAITVPAKNPGGVQQFSDLAKDSVTAITVPDPVKNSVGAHGMEALKGAGLWDKVSKKVVMPEFAADSNDTAGKGQTQAAIAYYPCVCEVHVKDAPPAVSPAIKVVGLVPDADYKAFSCEGAVVKGCQDPEGGKKLLATLMSPQAQQIFKQWNFTRTLQKQPS